MIPFVLAMGPLWTAVIGILVVGLLWWAAVALFPGMPQPVKIALTIVFCVILFALVLRFLRAEFPELMSM